MRKVYIEINSLNVSYAEFETIVWNTTHLDEIKTRKYISNEFEQGDAVIMQMIKFLNDQMDPIFVLHRWVCPVHNKKKTYDVALFWLKVLLNENVTCVFPPLDDSEFVSVIRDMSPPIYAKLLKTVNNF